MSLKTIKNENGVYVEIPKDKIEFVSKEAEIIYDLSLENDFLQQKNQELKKLLDYSLKLLSDIYPPCDIDGFMDKHSDYCQINCGVDEEIFKNCWLLYIEDKLKEGNK